MDIVGWNYLLTEILLRMPMMKRKLLKLKNLFIKNTFPYYLNYTLL